MSSHHEGMRAQAGGGRQRALLLLLCAAAAVLICGVLQRASGDVSEGAELLARAAARSRGRWQDLAVWNGKTEEDSEPDTSIAWHKPAWLDQAGKIARGDAEPFGHEKKQAENEEGGRFGHEDGELEETRELRGRLRAAERELEEAQKELERAEGGVNGKSDAVAGQKVGTFDDIKMVEPKGPEIKFSKTLVTNGETVRIEWSGVEQVSPLDFIALYTPPGAEDHDYLELHNVTSSDSWHTGQGFINVQLFNHRTEGGYEVRYFRKGQFPNDKALFLSTDSNLGQMVFCPMSHCANEDVYFLVSSSSKPAHFPVHEPTQVRLALTGVPTEMRVMWVSEKCPGKPLGGPAVIFSDESCKERKARTCRYPHLVKPLYRTYGAEDLCGPPANIARAQNFIDPGYIYDAVMSGLEPGRRYFYRVGCQDAPDGWHNEFLSHDTRGWGYPAGSMMSEEMSFVAAPWTTSKSTVSFIAYSDSGITTHQGNAHTTWGAPERVNAAIAKAVSAGRAGMVVHMGDLAYANGRGYMWEQWGALTQAVASSVPYMVAVGNHEYTHLPSIVVALEAPAAAEHVQYNALPAAFGRQLTKWRTGALAGAVVRAGGNYFKGPTLTDDFCLKELPDAEQLLQGRLLYRGKIVLVEAGSCGYARKVKVAQLYGAAAVIVFDNDDTLPTWAEMPHYPKVDDAAPQWTDAVSIPSVYMARKSGLDLLKWVDDHSAWKQSVRAVIRSSDELQVNDPSLLVARTSAAAEDEEAEGDGEEGEQPEPEGSEAEGADEEESGGGSRAATHSLRAEEAGYSGFHPLWGNFGDDSIYITLTRGAGSRGECGVPFAQRFHMPTKFGGNGNFWYSFEYGPVRVVSISTEHDLSRGSPQRVWLWSTLHRIDRRVSPWVVVMMHRSIYGRTESEAEQVVSDHLQRLLEPIFRRFRVNVVLSGHEHRYLRTAPVYMDLNMASTKGWGSTYAMVGTGGARLQYRAKDDVHHSYYCVGGRNPMKRCRGCTGDNKFVCHDREACCDYRLDGNDRGFYSSCGYCEHINATGPGTWKHTSRAGPRNAQRWGWQRKMLSDFGYMHIHASQFKMRLDFVQTLDVFHTPTVDEHGRSLHLPADVKVGCKDSCTKDMLPDGRVMDRLVLTRRHDGSLHAEDSELGGFEDDEAEGAGQDVDDAQASPEDDDAGAAAADYGK